jgi:hypothetical protein
LALVEIKAVLQLWQGTRNGPHVGSQRDNRPTRWWPSAE